MALVKRKKKPKPTPHLPARQVICGNCGAWLFVDDLPGGRIPSYECSNCRSSWSARDQLLVRGSKHEVERVFRSILAAKAKKQKLEKPGRAGLHWGVWQPAKADARKQKRLQRESEIFSKADDQLGKNEYAWILKTMRKLYPGLDPKSKGRGRKKDGKYDQWMNEIETAELSGKPRPLLRDLAGIPAPCVGSRDLRGDFLIQMQKVRDAFKKAKKRRQLPVPPSR